MALPKNSIAYSLGSGIRTCRGVQLEDGFDDYVKSRVSDRYHDKEGVKDLSGAFEDIPKTKFERTALAEIFKYKVDDIPWRFGECLAECFLEDFESAQIPYNGSRDQKNPHSSSTGADLIGFSCKDGDCVFLFGEVKTSSDGKAPPAVVYGRSGLIKQIESLATETGVRDNLVRWLAFKVSQLSKSDQVRVRFEAATRSYISNKGHIRLVGALIRDTKADENDLKTRFTAIVSRLDSTIQLEFLALYVPLAPTEYIKMMRQNAAKRR